jgi:hypothetical protein
MLNGMTDATTIKVPRTIRERISLDAARRGMTAAALIGELLDRYEREQRFAAVREAYTTPSDAGYVEEIAAWDGTAADGLRE